jgi:uncharacterized protein (TIGR02466 family)
MSDVLDQWQYFSTPVYSIMKPEHLDVAKTASNAQLSAVRKSTKMNDIYPVIQADLFSEEKLVPLYEYILNTAWNILSDQGYNMNGLSTHFTECWVQEHHKSSSMEHHHHNDCQLVAFYFLECPADPPKMVIHDPRSTKAMLPLYEQDVTNITVATSTINFTPTHGQLIFANSWLPHSFTRNTSTKPFKFIHMNIATRPYQAPVEYPATAEII